MATSISPGFKKLLSEPAFAEIATLMEDGSPQITQVWVDTDGEHILINTAENRQKTRNVRRDPRVAVNVVDPNNAWRLASVRGKVVDVTTEGSDDLIDRLAKKYLGQEKYPNRRADEVRVTLKIAPEKINEVGLDDSQGS
jgi:PPOX class probable F420-dependent enzyme